MNKWQSGVPFATRARNLFADNAANDRDEGSTAEGAWIFVQLPGRGYRARKAAGQKVGPGPTLTPVQTYCLPMESETPASSPSSSPTPKPQRPVRLPSMKPSTIRLEHIDPSRVPKLCPRHAFLPFLHRLTHCKINKLRTISMASKYKSPSGHHFCFANSAGTAISEADTA